MEILCPQCRKNPASLDPNIRPFCSKRCKEIDLGTWAKGGYRIPGEKPGEKPESDSSDDDS